MQRCVRTIGLMLVGLVVVGLGGAPTGLSYADARSQRATGSATTAGRAPQAAVARPPVVRRGFAETVTRGSLLENVAAVLSKRLVDQKYRTTVLPALLREFSARAGTVTSPREMRELVHEFLSRIPVSHLGLLSAESHTSMMNDLVGTPQATVGFQVVGLDGRLFACSVLEGGPAHVAGLLPWDRIVSIDEVPAEQSPRLGWRTDDAALSDDRDPPTHYLEVRAGETVRVVIERQRDERREIAIPVAEYSTLQAARASARLIHRAGRAIGYVHFHYIHISGVPQVLRELFDGLFAKCDGVVLDLRGRGGSAGELTPILDLLKRQRQSRHLPLVALVDRHSRSAKEVLADMIKTAGVATLVGERTAGAVVGATFADVGHGCVLLFPVVRLTPYTDRLELKGVEPDVPAPRPGPFSGGADPILDAGLAEILRICAVPERSR